ncbi:unnamed protein product [Brachionus calyciflorus]|uniref:4-hydroxyphenylpyruvate dioxygenase n=1 Tax=Brachionus calyciflorus TaxID=104777 RepID=A0A813MYQ5_9BILA|nr:unnamed protein product [Brachionus calyciflorus]
MINNLHHFEILTSSSQKLLNYFINGFKFRLVYSKKCEKYNQYLLNSNYMNFLVTSLSDDKRTLSTNPNLNCFETSLKSIQSADKELFSIIEKRENTVFNAAFRVADLDRVLFNCNRHNVPIIKKKHILKDEFSTKNGYVESAIIGSCISGVAHTLLDTNNYKGNFLPGFEPEEIANKTDNKSLATHFDHLTYATNKNTSHHIIDWYAKIFNMKRFKINREDLDGLMVQTGESGMNLKAIQYWLCAETGVELNSTENDFKFVISEPIDDEISTNKSKNQISIFLDEHDGPGIQHIGLNTPNIIESVRTSKTNSDQVKYYATPNSYYNNKDKLKEIEECGMNVDLLSENHILLDAEIDEKTEEKITQKKLMNKKFDKNYLLQVFTQPLFEKKTLFLELIQRVGHAQGFGAANIKALWDAVQIELNKKVAS